MEKIIRGMQGFIVMNWACNSSLYVDSRGSYIWEST
jgi:hypothetical protein